MSWLSRQAAGAREEHPLVASPGRDVAVTVVFAALTAFVFVARMGPSWVANASWRVKCHSAGERIGTKTARRRDSAVRSLQQRAALGVRTVAVALPDLDDPALAHATG